MSALLPQCPVHILSPPVPSSLLFPTGRSNRLVQRFALHFPHLCFFSITPSLISRFYVIDFSLVSTLFPSLSLSSLLTFHLHLSFLQPGAVVDLLPARGILVSKLPSTNLSRDALFGLLIAVSEYSAPRFFILSYYYFNFTLTNLLLNILALPQVTRWLYR